ncbi:MAG: carbohydrate porin [Planctomycetota bacterium]
MPVCPFTHQYRPVWTGKLLGVLPALSIAGPAIAQPATPGEADSELRPLGELRPTLEEFGIEFELGLTSVFQLASESQGERDSLASYSYDFAGQWTLIDDATGTGAVGWLVEGGRPLFSDRDSDLGADVGSALGINDDLDNTDIDLTEFWWTHELLDGSLALTLGKIDQTAFFDGNAIANDETAAFLATPLVNSSGVAFPDNGLGFNATFTPSDLFYISGGLVDSDPEGERVFSSFNGNELFGAIEIGFTPVIDGLGQGNYRVLGWTTQLADGTSGSGFSFSLDQEIGGGLVPFARYSQGDEDVLDFEEFISGGIGMQGLGGREDDLLGVGFAWGDAVGGGEETLFEAFYNIAVNEFLTVTPHVQYIYNPLGNPTEDDATVVGFRLQATY